jgi:acetyl-CoA C-acetyltransferase
VSSEEISEKKDKKKMSSPPSPVSEDRVPVIVGVGEITDRPADLKSGLEPLALLEEALKRAEADSGGKLLGDIQSLDIVNFLSWRYREPEKLLSERLGITPRHAYYGPVGGESPIRYLHEAAQRIARGECSVRRSAAPKPSRRPPRPSAPKSICRGRRSRMTWKSRSAAPRSRSRCR